MSQKNMEAVRAAYERYAQGDFSSWTDLSDDFEFVTSSEMPDAGTYRGEAARRWMRAWVESFKDLTIRATEIIDADEKVVVAITQTGRPLGSQTVVAGHWWVVMTFRGGEVSRTEAFPERAQAIEAAGLSE